MIVQRHQHLHVQTTQAHRMYHVLKLCELILYPEKEKKNRRNLICNKFYVFIKNVILNIFRAIDDDDPELIRAFNESKYSEPIEMDGVNATESASDTAHGAQKQLYMVEDEAERLYYPQFLLARILENRKRNRQLEHKLQDLKKQCFKRHQENLAKRLMSVTKVSEPIEIP